LTVEDLSADREPHLNRYKARIHPWFHFAHRSGTEKGADGALLC
jgi:hypothetical protein